MSHFHPFFPIDIWFNYLSINLKNHTHTHIEETQLAYNNINDIVIFFFLFLCQSEYDIVTIRNTAYRFVLGNGSCGGGGLIIGEGDESTEAMISSLSTGDLEDVTAEWKRDIQIMYLHHIELTYTPRTKSKRYLLLSCIRPPQVPYFHLRSWVLAFSALSLLHPEFPAAAS